MSTENTFFKDDEQGVMINRCFHRDQFYLYIDDNKVEITDEMLDAMVKYRAELTNGEKQNGVEPLARLAGWVGEADCRFEKSGYCEHANPKICKHAEKIHKTKKGEVQQWICELAL